MNEFSGSTLTGNTRISAPRFDISATGLVGNVFSNWRALLVTLALLMNCGPAFGDPTSLPRLTIDQLEFEGAFRISNQNYGPSSMNWSTGAMLYNPDNDSLFLAGHDHDKLIMELKIPPLVKSTNLAELNIASNALQVFSLPTVMNRVPNPQNINYLSSFAYIRSGDSASLVVNAHLYYDANNTGSDTTLIVRDARDLANSRVDGYFRMQGKVRAAGWMTPIPVEWQEKLGGQWITGNSSWMPIISRTSVGPSAFVFDPVSLVESPNPSVDIPTLPLIDYPHGTETTLASHFIKEPLVGASPLDDAFANAHGNNNMWTYFSFARFGMIIPGTRTYMAIGQSGGHNPPEGYSGICYKDSNDKFYPCPPGVVGNGFMPSNPDDKYDYYWLYDVNDMLSVKQGRAAPHSLVPYASGVFPTDRVFSDSEGISGATYDPKSGRIYVSLRRADRIQSGGGNPPVIVAFRIADLPAADSMPSPPTNVRAE